jgi:hypothetical protein
MQLHPTARERCDYDISPRDNRFLAPGEVDPEKNARWILERVLQRGRWEDWLLNGWTWEGGRNRFSILMNTIIG